MGLLDGIRVVEFSQLIAAPFCGLQLLDLGASVIKVEPPAGDTSRSFEPFIDGAGAVFHALNRGKQGVTVDFGSDAGRRRVRELIDGADVVVENMGPGVTALGTDYADAVARNPKLIWCSITGTGHGRGDRAVDGVIQAEWGLMSVTGDIDGGPVRVGVHSIDCMTAMYATQQVLTALWQVERGGDGRFLDCAMLDASTSLSGWQALLAGGGVLEPRRLGSESHVRVPTGAFVTRDGFLQINCVTERHWQGLCRAIGREEWIDDPRFATNDDRLRQRTVLRGLIAAAVAHETTDHWVTVIRAERSMCAPIRDITEAWADPRLRERGLIGTTPDGHELPIISLTGGAPVDALPRGPRLGE